MSTWSTPSERRAILTDHHCGIGVSELARRFGYSRSGIYNMLLTAAREERKREQRERLQAAYGLDRGSHQTRGSLLSSYHHRIRSLWSC